MLAYSGDDQRRSGSTRAPTHPGWRDDEQHQARTAASPSRGSVYGPGLAAGGDPGLGTVPGRLGGPDQVAGRHAGLAAARPPAPPPRLRPGSPGRPPRPAAPAGAVSVTDVMTLP